MILEYYCSKAHGGCLCYFDVDIDGIVNGNIAVKCPMCKSSHMAVIRNSQITSDKYDETLGRISVLIPLPQSMRKKSITHQRYYT